MARPALERLGDRQLLAGITFDTATFAVVIDGSTGPDVARVDYLDATRVVVTLTGVPQQIFTRAQVNAVRFYGYGGNDSFFSSTAIATTAWGHGGDDSLHGGTGTDRFYAGIGNDFLAGNDGNDLLYGLDGNDVIEAGRGNDLAYGGNGDDQLAGQDGNDLLSGDEGADSLAAGAGEDQVYGGNGNDQLDGGDGNDLLGGGEGADQILGGAGMDRAWAGGGNDMVDGGAGEDRLYGQAGDDVLSGGDAGDLLTGGDGNDQLHGGNGNDGLYGDAGNDTLLGGAGEDWLYGGDGKDQLYGEADADRLDGGHGNDGLFGGTSAGDILTGGGDYDRFLTWYGDGALTDYGSNEAILNFRNETAFWTEAEIQVVDAAFRLLHDTNGSGRILRDSLDNDPVTYLKYASLPNSAPAANSLSGSGVVGNLNYTRQIWVADWNESSSALNEQVKHWVIHEIGHSWDSALEIGNRRPNLQGLWDQFLALSGWRNSNPGSSQYSLSGDGQWWHLTNAPFVRNYSRYNPREDWGTVWEILYDPTMAQDRARVQAKVNLITQLIAGI
jgi:RTX calcium-binding nonapeptide repeat (4 copies)